MTGGRTGIPASGENTEEITGQGQGHKENVETRAEYEYEENRKKKARLYHGWRGEKMRRKRGGEGEERNSRNRADDIGE